MNTRQTKLEMLEWRHAHDLQRVATDLSDSEWSNIPHVYFVNGTQSLIQRSFHLAANDKAHMLALYVEGDLMGVFNIQKNVDAPELGELLFWIDSTAWKSGVAKEYLKEVIRFSFEDLGLERLGAVCRERNTLCRRNLEKVGFKMCGRRRVVCERTLGDDTDLLYEIYPGMK